MKKGKTVKNAPVKKDQPADPRKPKTPFYENNLVSMAILCVVFLLAYLYIFDAKFDLNGDNFAYLNLANSLKAGDGYTVRWFLGMPPASHFPPGYPVILAALKLFTGSAVALKMANGLFFLGSILFLFLLMVKITGQKLLSLVIATFLLLNSGLHYYATILMSEMPYLFFSMAVFYLLFLLHHQGKMFVNFRFYLVIMVAMAAYYTRNVGLTLLAAVALHLVFTLKWKEALAFAAGIIVLYLPWKLRNASLGIESRYLDTALKVNIWRPEEGTITSAGQFFTKMLQNFDETVIKGFSSVIFPFAQPDMSATSTPVMVIAGIAVLGIVLFGAWKTGHLKFLSVFYILANVLILMVWHGGNGNRYVWPLAPFLTFFFFYGLYCLARVKLKPEGLKWTPLLLLLLFPSALTNLKSLNQKAKADYPPAYKNYFALAKEFNTPEKRETVVICRKPEIFHYYSNTFTGNYKYTPDDKALLQDLIDKKAEYVVLEQLGFGSTPRYLLPAIQKHPEVFIIEKHLPNPDTWLFSFDAEMAAKAVSE